MKPVVSTQENLLGIAYDSIGDKLYWTNFSGQIYRANTDGSQIEPILSTEQCESISCLETKLSSKFSLFMNDFV